jgi:putative transposase
MPQELTIAALQMAIVQRCPGPGLLHHPDRGSQYAAHAYRRLLEKSGMPCSMSRKGNCWDNAPMESFFRSMKSELGENVVFVTRQESKVAIFGFVETFVIAAACTRRSAIAHPSNGNTSQRPLRS